MTKIQRVLLSLLVVATTAASALAGGAAPAMTRSPADAARDEIKSTLGYVPLILSVVPDRALPGLWLELKGLALNPKSALPAKIKDAIGLAVASQIPCKYCVYAHSQFMLAEGATAEEVQEAIMVAAIDRHWSTIFNGMALDEGKFKADVARFVETAKKMMASKAPPPRPMMVTDAKTAMADIQQMFGFVPDFIKQVPADALAGAWTELRDVELAETALPAKYKDLIGLAVAAQIPCRYCVLADTEFARLDGATDQEIQEAVTMAGLTREMSAIAQGSAIDEAASKKDVDRLVKTMKKMMAASAAK
jgi:AhpD family alkylhydroperoxidase